MRQPILLGLFGLLVGCGGDVPEGADTFAEGRARYADADTDASGAEAEPARPSGPLDVEIRLEGTGDLSGLRPECEIEGASGAFTGLLEGSGTIDDDGVYTAALVSSDGTFSTPSGGCEIPDLSIGLVTDVVVVGRLEATQRNCETYCAARARSEAESACEGDSDEASCRAEAEAEYEASCTTACTGETTHTLVAEASLGADALTAINADLGGFGATGLGAVEADLTFDHIEDADGETVDEAP